MTLTTLKQFNELLPETQGYVWYMEAEHDGSELPKKCPYPKSSKERKKWDKGANRAMINVIDDDDE